MKNVTNINLNDMSDAKRAHEIKIATNRLVKLAEETQVPIFVAYFDSQKEDYQYNGVFPEEIGTDDVKNQYGKFYEFLKVCIGFNKADLGPKIERRKS